MLIRSNGYSGSNLYSPGYFSGFDYAPDDSMAMFDVIGPIVKYGYCNDGNYELNQLVQEAKASPRIKGAFFNVDCPGGQIDGIKTFAESIKNFGKPTLAFCNGLMASAAVTFGTAADEVYASQSLDTFGCIGTLYTIWDQSEYLKKMGIRVIERYAPQSTEKNKTQRDALKGNFSQLDDNLKTVTADAINAIAANRGYRLKGDPSNWNKGQDGFASWALSIGMIDGICSFEDAVSRLDALCDGAESLAVSIPSSDQAGSDENTPPIDNQNTNPEIDMEPFESLLALAGVENPSDQQLDQANACLTVNNITGATIVRESFITEAAAETTRANGLQEQVNTLTASAATNTTELATANSTITSQATKITDLEAKVAAFGKNAGALHQEKKGEDTPPEGGDNTADLLSGLAHNQTADKVLGKK
jgi:ClpP class serine protease